ncbi:hypothetical protein CTAYLR_010740 [Chrysophaeum taylorii]|uniref:Kinesin motor domain-containing protein n=1 Tax=Chrysophaeum taylorii TaxID=2483200 RepID=A0AAD7U6K0_9STRA|nr:hypothetical protein CTAYLR_010740 [Chrysophaeum taylorii]
MDGDVALRVDEGSRQKIAALEKEVSDELRDSHKLLQAEQHELERAKLISSFNERCEAFRRYEEKLERRAKAAEKRRAKDREETLRVRADNQKLAAEVEAARDFIALLQQAQRARLSDALCEPCPPAAMPKVGPGMVAAAATSELQELRVQAATLARTLEQAKKGNSCAATFLDNADIAEAAECRSRLELAVERERKRTSEARIRTQSECRRVSLRAFVSLAATMKKRFEMMALAHSFRTWSNATLVRAVHRVVTQAELSCRKRIASMRIHVSVSRCASFIGSTSFADIPPLPPPLTMDTRRNADHERPTGAAGHLGIEPHRFSDEGSFSALERQVAELVDRFNIERSQIHRTLATERLSHESQMAAARTAVKTANAEARLFEEEAESSRRSLERVTHERDCAVDDAERMRRDVEAAGSELKRALGEARREAESAISTLRNVEQELEETEARKEQFCKEAEDDRERCLALRHDERRAAHAAFDAALALAGRAQHEGLIQAEALIQTERERWLLEQAERDGVASNAEFERRAAESAARSAAIQGAIGEERARADEVQGQLRALLSLERERALEAKATCEDVLAQHQISEMRHTAAEQELSEARALLHDIQHECDLAKAAAAASSKALPIEAARALAAEEVAASLETKLKSCVARSRRARLRNLRLAAQAARAEARATELCEDWGRAATTAGDALRIELDVSRFALDESRQRLQQALGRIEEVEEARRKDALEAGPPASTRELADLRARTAELEEALRHANSIRRRLHNTLQNLRGNVRVVARVRPPNNTNGRGHQDAVAVDSDGCTIVLRPPSRDGVDGTALVFEEVEELVQSAMDGYDVSILAYTMHGDNTAVLGDGIIPRATVALTVSKAQLESQGWRYAIEASSVEVYDEKVYDLLAGWSDVTRTTCQRAASDGPALELRTHRASDVATRVSPIVEGITAWRVDPADPEAISNLVKRAAASRTTRTTALNDRSSRSHAVFIIQLRGYHEGQGTRTSGSLVLVDLAGSERAGRSGAVDDQLREACSINKSLSCLVDVFAALARLSQTKKKNCSVDCAKHVPYRNSKLTRLLQTSLSGDGKALLIVALSPETSALAETTCTLRFASEVARIECGRPTKRTRRSPRNRQSESPVPRERRARSVEPKGPTIEPTSSAPIMYTLDAQANTHQKHRRHQ